MITLIPEEVYTVKKDRFLIIRKNVETYQKASKKVKTQILDELSHILHMKRQYIALL